MTDSLKEVVDILEEHLRAYGQETSSEAFIFIQNEIYKYRSVIRDSEKSE